MDYCSAKPKGKKELPQLNVIHQPPNPHQLDVGRSHLVSKLVAGYQRLVVQLGHPKVG
jgi:hypothetical protein